MQNCGYLRSNIEVFWEINIRLSLHLNCQIICCISAIWTDKDEKMISNKLFEYYLPFLVLLLQISANWFLTNFFSMNTFLWYPYFTPSFSSLSLRIEANSTPQIMHSIDLFLTTLWKHSKHSNKWPHYRLIIYADCSHKRHSSSSEIISLWHISFV